MNSFKNLEVIGRIDVKMVVSDEYKMEMTLEGIDRGKINIINENETLKIKIVNTLSYKNVRVMIRLYCDNVINIAAFSSATIFSEETLIVDTISLKTESGGELTFKMIADSISSTCSTRGIISIAGKTKTHKANVFSGGTLSSTDLESDKYMITVNSKGIARIKVINELHAKANSGGYISYIGEPLVKILETTLKGKIEKINY
jgi:hypothetical protein